MLMNGIKNRLFFSAISLLIAGSITAQTVTGALGFTQGQTLAVSVELKNTMAQQAMGQSIDFSANGVARHQFVVSNQTADNTTLHHTVQGIRFSFDGMGAKKSFDSDKSSDLQSAFGKPIREWLKQSYHLIIDTVGKTMMVQSPKMPATEQDDQFKFITGLLGDLMGVANPPAKNEPSLFAVLPAGNIAIGDTWNHTGSNREEQWSIDYTLTAITDTAIVVSLKGISSRQQQADMRGMTVTTTVKSLSTGSILIDPATRLLRQKKIHIESSGTAEMMGNSTPVSSKTDLFIQVIPQP